MNSIEKNKAKKNPRLKNRGLFYLISKWEWENKVIDLNLFESILNIVDKKEEIKWNPELSKYHIFKDKYDKFASDFIDVHLSKKVKSL